MGALPQSVPGVFTIDLRPTLFKIKQHLEDRLGDAIAFLKVPHERSDLGELIARRRGPDDLKMICWKRMKTPSANVCDDVGLARVSYVKRRRFQP